MWDKLLTVCPNKTTTFFIVDDFLLMKEKTMERARRARTAPESRAARNMYNAIWSTLSGTVKTSIIEHKQNYKTDGPSLLFYLLRKYTGMQTSVVRQTIQKVDLLGEYMGERFKHDVEAYCSYAQSLIIRLREAGHKDTHLTEKIYEGLLTTPCDDFTQDLKVWRESYRLNNTVFSIDDIISHAREKYRHYKFTVKTWPDYEKNTNKKRKRQDELNDTTDLTSLLSLKSKQKKRLIAMLSEGKPNHFQQQRKGKQNQGRSAKQKHDRSMYSYECLYGPEL